MDSHCCSEDGYAKDGGSGESDNGLVVAAVVPSKSVPVEVAVNATSVGQLQSVMVALLLSPILFTK